MYNLIHDESQPARRSWVDRPLLGLGLGGTLLVLYALYLWLFLRMAGNPGLLAGEKLSWYVVRSSGVVAYCFLAAGTVWGLVLSSKFLRWRIAAPVAFALHNNLSWAAIGFTLLHAAMLLFDRFYTYTLANLLIPFTGPYERFWVGLGILGLYLMLLTSLSFYVRKRIGQATWRRLHYLTFLAFVMVTLHGWMAGTDNQLLAGLYVASSSAVAFLTSYRILNAAIPGRSSASSRQSSRG